MERGRRAGAMHPVRAYLIAAGSVGFALGAAWSIALSIISASDRAPPLLRMLAITTGSAIAVPAAPVLAAVLLIRACRWPRGNADAIAGAIIALLLSVLVIVAVEGLFADFRTPVTLRAAAGLAAFWLAPNTIAGAIAGLFYAHLAAPIPIRKGVDTRTSGVVSFAPARRHDQARPRR